MPLKKQLLKLMFLLVLNMLISFNSGTIISFIGTWEQNWQTVSAGAILNLKKKTQKIIQQATACHMDKVRINDFYGIEIKGGNFNPKCCPKAAVVVNAWLEESSLF